MMNPSPQAPLRRHARICGAARRRRYPRRRAAARASARRAARRQGRACRARPSRRPRPRAGAPHRRDRAAPARLAAPRGRRLSRSRPAARRAARRDRAADRRRANPAARRARRTRRSTCRCGMVQADRRAARYAGLVNAVLRRIAREGAARLAALDPAALDTPEWLMRRWIDAYGQRHRARDRGRQCARAGARSHRQGRRRPNGPAKLRGRVLPTGSVRTLPHGPVPLMPGFAEGAWWVQDAAAALPARLFGDVSGLQRRRSVRRAGRQDAAARPGGRARHRGRPLRAAARPAARQPAAAAGSRPRSSRPMPPSGPAGRSTPCWSMRPARRPAPSAGIPTSPGSSGRPTSPALTALQRRLLERAIALTRPGGTIVFCTCSLEPEEGEQLIAGVLADHPEVRRKPISPSEINGLDGLITPRGELRTLPCGWPDPDPRMAGLDGFYAARLERI